MEEIETILNNYKQLQIQQDALYENIIQRTNEEYRDLLNENLGKEFLESCGRDLAGEIVRQFFDTSDFNITIDQLAERIFNFSYENDFDPIKDDVKKSVYNYNDNEKYSKSLNKIFERNKENQEKLFEKDPNTKRYKDKNLIESGKRHYVNSVKQEDGTIIDEYTGKEGDYVTDKNGNQRRRQEVDHIQAAATATYNERYLTKEGVRKLKIMMNCPDNFAMMDKVANESKGDVRVYEKDGKILSKEETSKLRKDLKESIKNKYKNNGIDKTDKEINDEVEQSLKNYDISFKATPKQLADATCERWEKVTNDKTRQELIDKGYLNEDGKVPESVKKQLEANIRHSQNVESQVILKNTDYKQVGVDAAVDTAKNLWKIVAGQILYYATPPLVYEVRIIIQEKDITIDNALKKIEKAGKRIGNYVFDHMKDIFVNIGMNTLKKFIKSFMDILINLVKATVKKLLSVGKTLVLCVVDSVRIIGDKNRTAAEKADAVFSLFAVTITNIAIECLFEYIESQTGIPEWLLTPLQILTTIVSSNFIMLVLKKLDLFDVRFGLKLQNIKELFENANKSFIIQCENIQESTEAENKKLVENLQLKIFSIYNHLNTISMYDSSIRSDVEMISKIYEMNVNFEDEWNKYLGII